MGLEQRIIAQKEQGKEIAGFAENSTQEIDNSRLSDEKFQALAHMGQAQQEQDQGKIEMIQERLVEQKVKSHPLNELFQGIHPDILKRIPAAEQLRVLMETQNVFAADPKLEQRYRALLIEHDYSLLREQSRVRAEQLRALLFEKIPGGLRAFFSPSIRRERSAQEQKLASFEAFIQQAKVIRSDRHKREVFNSPRITGVIASYGTDDTLVQADRYVYASLDAFPHPMSQSNQTVSLEQDGFDERAEFVMIDAADLRPRSREAFLQTYLDNLFSFQEGKQILASYLANVFDSVDEAKAWLQANTGQRPIIQNWETATHPYTPWEKPQSEEDWIQKQKLAEQRSEQIVDRIKELRERFGIEPPLAIEVRIPEEARVSNSMAESIME